MSEQRKTVYDVKGEFEWHQQSADMALSLHGRCDTEGCEFSSVGAYSTTEKFAEWARAHVAETGHQFRIIGGGDYVIRAKS